VSARYAPRMQEILFVVQTRQTGKNVRCLFLQTDSLLVAVPLHRPVAFLLGMTRQLADRLNDELLTDKFNPTKQSTLVVRFTTIKYDLMFISYV
jgi:hypothetical protein